MFTLFCLDLQLKLVHSRTAIQLQALSRSFLQMVSFVVLLILVLFGDSLVIYLSFVFSLRSRSDS